MFFLLPVLLLTGCNRPEKSFSPFKEGAVWDVAFEDLRFTVFTSPGVSDAEITFSEPEILKNMKVKIGADGLSADFGDMNVPITEAFIGNVFPFYRAVRALSESETQQAEQNDVTYRAILNGDGSVSGIEVKGTDGKTVVYTVLSAVRRNDNSKSQSQDPS